MTTKFSACIPCNRLRPVQPSCNHRKLPTLHIRKGKNVEIRKTASRREWNSVFRCPILTIQTCSTTISSKLITNLRSSESSEQVVVCRSTWTTHQLRSFKLRCHDNPLFGMCTMHSTTASSTKLYSSKNSDSSNTKSEKCWNLKNSHWTWVKLSVPMSDFHHPNM